MRHLVVYSADIHGNEFQYKKLVNFAKTISAHSLVIGGDIAPKRGRREYFISMQRTFLSEKLPNLLLPFKKELPASKIYLMMGNDDCACNLDVLERYDNELFHIIYERRMKLTMDFDIVGYSFVPITPFMLKDWEKFDLSEVPTDLAIEYTQRKSSNYALNGFKSTLSGFQPFQFCEDIEKKDSIQKDLHESMLTRKPGRTVYVIHSPPNQTKLDQRYDDCHVGSLAVKLFIEKYQPYLTLHGHIHETVERSGEYKQKIGKTLCLTSGNDDLSFELAVLVFDLYDPWKVTREIIL